MKKLTVMAACAALLLGGGCFLKANQMNNELIALNVHAFGEDNPFWLQEVEDWTWGSGTCGVKFRWGYGAPIQKACGIPKWQATRTFDDFKMFGDANWCCDSCSSTDYCG